MSERTSYQEHAALLAEKGWAVIPLALRSKKPLIKEWQKLATKDPEQIAQWWRKDPSANIGIACGPSGLVVIDLDVKNGVDGLDTWNELCGKLGISPETTRMSQTASGGRHLFYAAPPDIDVRNRAGTLLGAGIDVRGNGGYVVAPPSVTPQGRYLWRAEGDPPPLPDALVELLARRAQLDVHYAPAAGTRDHSAYVRAVVEDEAKKVESAPVGQRNDLLNRAAFSLGQLVASPWAHLDRESARDALLAAARACGLQDSEALATINSGLAAGMAQPRQEPTDRRRSQPGPARQMRSDLVMSDPEGTPQSESPPTDVQERSCACEEIEGPYSVKDGCLVYLKDVGKGDVHALVPIPIASFEARIVEEITEEEGERSYRIAGAGLRGGPFALEISATDFSDTRKLKAALDSPVGALDPVWVGMDRHLGPAIKSCTPANLPRTRRYHRTGWSPDGFLLPGREGDGVDVRLPTKLPYSASPEADLAKGIEALGALIEAMGPERGTVVIAYALQAPLAKLAGWRNERYGLFVSGRTGSLKTSFCQCVLCIYGSEFMRDELLTKWGEGATRNAIMALATYAHDMPLLLDNFKPSTGGGTKDFVNLMHNILEGGEKDRLNRAAELRETRPVYCWPLVTGEDVPDKDPATLARLLIVQFPWQRSQSNAQLARAQELHDHLPAVGGVWLDWLESEKGTAIAKQAQALCAEKRAEWANYLRTLRPDMVNILRVASNLASNQMAYRALTRHPVLGELFLKYADDHQTGLATIARTMANGTAEALEATRYLAALRDLIASGRVYLLRDTSEPPPSAEIARQPFVGWYDGDGGVYLIPAVMRLEIERLVGAEQLGRLSDAALYSQLDALGAIASKTGNDSTKVIKISGKSTRVLHLAPWTLTASDPVTDPAAA